MNYADALNALIDKYTYSHATTAEKARQKEFARELLEMVKNEGAQQTRHSPSFYPKYLAVIDKALEELKK